MNGEHATMVNGKGRDITDGDLLAAAHDAGITEALAKEVIERTRRELAG